MQSYQFIKNINDLYKPALNPAQQPFYADFLDKYTDNQLDELWSYAMNNHCRTSPPTIGELGKFAQNVTPTRNISPELQKKIEIQNLTEEDIFSTQLGRQALREGWACSYLVTCQEKGIISQTEEVATWFQKKSHAAEKAAYSLDGKNDPFSKGLKKLWKTMQERENEWKKEFSYLINDNIEIQEPQRAVTAL